MWKKVHWLVLPIVVGALATPAWADDGTKKKVQDKTKQAATSTKEAASDAADKTKQAGRDAGNAINDAWLTAKVKAQYWGDDALDGSDIDVDTNNNVVTLNGTVPTAAAREHAMKVARATEGVTKVVDNLTIGPKREGDAARRTKELGKDVKRETKEMAKDAKDAAKGAGRSASEGIGTTGQTINDAWITTKVKSQYWGDDVLEGSRINVDTANRIVTLKGTVPNEAARNHAISVARATEGVKGVTDQLKIGPKPKPITPVK
jgi:osmotically-inducible protein OsmY